MFPNLAGAETSAVHRRRFLHSSSSASVADGAAVPDGAAGADGAAVAAKAGLYGTWPTADS